VLAHLSEHRKPVRHCLWFTQQPHETRDSVNVAKGLKVIDLKWMLMAHSAAA